MNTKKANDIYYNKYKDLLSSNKNLSIFLNKLSLYGEIGLVGGSVRDWILNNKPKDLDIIFNYNNYENIYKAIEGFDYRENSFGGYKFTIDDQEIDLWSLDKTDQYITHPFIEKNFETLSQICFLNMESCNYNITTNTFYQYRFFDALEKNEIDLVFPETRGLEGRILKIFSYHKRYNMDISCNCLSLIYKQIKNGFLDSIEEYQINKFKKVLFSVKEIKEILLKYNIVL